MAKVPKIDRRLLGEYLNKCVNRDLAELRKSKISHREWVHRQLLLSNVMLFLESGG